MRVFSETLSVCDFHNVDPATQPAEITHINISDISIKGQIEPRSLRSSMISCSRSEMSER